MALQVINSDRNHEHNTRHTAYRWGYVPYSVPSLAAHFTGIHCVHWLQAVKDQVTPESYVGAAAYLVGSLVFNVGCLMGLDFVTAAIAKTSNPDLWTQVGPRRNCGCSHTEALKHFPSSVLHGLNAVERGAAPETRCCPSRRGLTITGRCCNAQPISSWLRPFHTLLLPESCSEPVAKVVPEYCLRSHKSSTTRSHLVQIDLRTCRV